MKVPYFFETKGLKMLIMIICVTENNAVDWITKLAISNNRTLERTQPGLRYLNNRQISLDASQTESCGHSSGARKPPDAEK
jgi:hypothetical protein